MRVPATPGCQSAGSVDLQRSRARCLAGQQGESIPTQPSCHTPYHSQQSDEGSQHVTVKQTLSQMDLPKCRLVQAGPAQD